MLYKFFQFQKKMKDDIKEVQYLFHSHILSHNSWISSNLGERTTSTPWIPSTNLGSYEVRVKAVCVAVIVRTIC